MSSLEGSGVRFLSRVRPISLETSDAGRCNLKNNCGVLADVVILAFPQGNGRGHFL